MPDDGCVHLNLSHDVYDRDAVVEAAQAFAAHDLRFAVLGTSTDETEIAVRTPLAVPEVEPILDEFLNHALDLSIRRKLGRS